MAPEPGNTAGNPATLPAERQSFWSRLRPPDHPSDGIWALQYVPFYLAAGTLLFFLLSALIGALLPPHTPRLWGEFAGEFVFAVAAIVPAFATAAAEHRTFSEYGLPLSQAFAKGFWVGVGWGAVALTALLVVMRLIGVLTFGHISLDGNHILKFGVFWAAFFLLVALFEEFAFRGYLLFTFTRTAGFWPSALLLSALFGFVHHTNSGETWMGAIGAGAVGLFFCRTLQRTGNLWLAVGMHASWDWTQSFIFGVRDSGVLEPGHLLSTSMHGPDWLTGGSAGPEGSVLLLILIAVLWIVLDRVYPPPIAAAPLPQASGGSGALQ